MMKWKSEQWQAFNTAARSLKASLKAREEAIRRMDGFLPSLKDEKARKKTFYIIKVVIEELRARERAAEYMESDTAKSIDRIMEEETNKTPAQRRAEKEKLMLLKLQINIEDWEDEDSDT